MAAGAGLAVFEGVTALANSFFGYKTQTAEITKLKQQAENEANSATRELTLKAIELKEKQLSAQIDLDKSKRLQGSITLITLVGAIVFLIVKFKKPSK